MLELHEQGHSSRAIAQMLGCDHKTVLRYVRQGEWRPMRREPGSLDGLEGWLEERMARHRGNADVIRQELIREHGIEVSLRTVERAVKSERQRLRAARKATERFESPPGEQMQIDFGSQRLAVGGQKQLVRVFVATLGYSRRQFAAAYEEESQRCWFDGMERAFRHFEGVPRTVLMDNARALVIAPGGSVHRVRFHPRLLAFARHWDFKPRACRPYRAQTKGKDERSVGYVKGNALSGRRFAGWGDLDRHLQTWLRTVADVRVHGTTHETPLSRFAEERAHLGDLAGRPTFGAPTDLTRRVAVDCFVALDTNHYSVPWQLVGETVRLTVGERTVRIHHGASCVATHELHRGRHGRVVNPEHVQRIGRKDGARRIEPRDASLVRPLEQYETLTGGKVQ